jgi:PEP-CTERM motif
MGFRCRSIGIAISVLLALIVVRPANADSFTFSFTGNQSWCASYVSACTDSGSGTFTTDPLTFSPIYNPSAYPVTSIDGTVDGFSMSILINYNPGAIPGPGTMISYNPGPIKFTSDGQEWGLVRFDVGPWNDFLANYSTGKLEPINLTIQAPEPSALLLMGVGLISLLGLTLLKNRSH